jgi:hypothetical protein
VLQPEHVAGTVANRSRLQGAPPLAVRKHPLAAAALEQYVHVRVMLQDQTAFVNPHLAPDIDRKKRDVVVKAPAHRHGVVGDLQRHVEPASPAGPEGAGRRARALVPPRDHERH